jgi:hypothetical protein
MASQDLSGQTTGPPVGQDFDLARPIESFVETARTIVFQPVAFFSRLPRQGNLGSPLIFALICYGISALISGVIGLLSGHDIGALIGGVVAAIIGGAIGLFIVAGIAHLLVILIVGSTNSGYEATFRAAAYSSVSSLVSWVPVVGPLAGLYGLVLAIVGIRELHQTSTGKAIAVALVPIVFLVVVAYLALFLILSSIHLPVGRG